MDCKIVFSKSEKSKCYQKRHFFLIHFIKWSSLHSFTWPRMYASWTVSNWNKSRVRFLYGNWHTTKTFCFVLQTMCKETNIIYKNLFVSEYDYSVAEKEYNILHLYRLIHKKVSFSWAWFDCLRFLLASAFLWG